MEREILCMNLNEQCLLDYLKNPNELTSLTIILEENNKFLQDDVILVTTQIVR